MQSKKLAGAKPPSTQKYLDIAGIRDDIVIMKDGSLRAVLLTSSLNFALKSEDEQNAVISNYVSFLNSFDFPLQIVIQSRKLNIDAYLEKLKTMEKEQTNELLRVQTREYRQFVEELLTMERIMAKRFYVVVPYSPFSDAQKGFFSRLSEALKAAAILRLTETKFQERRRELLGRVNLIATGLQSMGLNAIPLTTQSLIELYYNTYNPDVSEQERLAPIEKMRVE
ncbi:MAG: TraC family protein [bacterium]|nr:TraC family protein [bacterium]